MEAVGGAAGGRPRGAKRVGAGGRKLPAEPLMWLLSRVTDRTGNEMLAIEALRRAVDSDPHSGFTRAVGTLITAKIVVPQSAKTGLNVCIALLGTGLAGAARARRLHRRP